MPQRPIALVTAKRMPKPDPESGLLVAALERRGVSAELRIWDRPCDWAAFALVVSRTPWDYFHRVEEFLAWARAAAQLTTLVNPLQTIVWNAHKSYLLDLQRAGVPVVPTVVVGRGAAPAEQAAAVELDGDLVIKPAVAGGALGAARIADGDRAGAGAHLRTVLRTQDALVQPFMSAVSEGEVSLVFFGGRFSHAVRKVPADGEFRVHGHYGGTVAGHTPDRAEHAVAEAALAAAPTPIAYGRIDLVRGPGGPAVMEAELIEPELFLGANPAAPERFADELVRLMSAPEPFLY